MTLHLVNLQPSPGADLVDERRLTASWPLSWVIGMQTPYTGPVLDTQIRHGNPSPLWPGSVEASGLMPVPLLTFPTWGQSFYKYTDSHLPRSHSGRAKQVSKHPSMRDGCRAASYGHESIPRGLRWGVLPLLIQFHISISIKRRVYRHTDP